MGESFVIGVLTSVLTIAIQALATILAIRLVRLIARHLPPRQRVGALVLVMASAGTMLTLAHLVEVAVWAQLYALVGAVPMEDAYYLAFVNFTTLGYGDILPAPDWRVLGPFAAANGMLLFGWSTAVLFAVLTRSLHILHLR
ncbi:potassium channel family protein [Xanthobacter sp. KR7-65]|uniref:potassium channel family protein n=1 Tax=Xanthobacter sp. KR7-65 TaxID=3156612 RepID=UPI0032B3D7C4